MRPDPVRAALAALALASSCAFAAEGDCAADAADGMARCTTPRLYPRAYAVCTSTHLDVGEYMEDRCRRAVLSDPWAGPRNEQELDSLIACLLANGPENPPISTAVTWGAPGSPTPPGMDWACGEAPHTFKYGTEIRNHITPIPYPYGWIFATRWRPAKCLPPTTPVGDSAEYPDYCVEPVKHACENTPNPMGIANGVRLLTQTDLPATATSPLEFTRSYTSAGFYRPPRAWLPESRGFGEFWRHTYDRRVLPERSEHLMASVLRPTGTVKHFRLDGRAVLNDDSSADTLTRLADAQDVVTGWIYRNGAAYERYDARGKLLAITDPAGRTTTLEYSDAQTPAAIAPVAGLLIRVIDPFGRYLAFEYDAASRIARMTDPNGGTFGYAYNADGMLVAVTYPDGHTRRYLYNENPTPNQNIGTQALTGIVDESGVRLATYGYGSVNGAFDYAERAGATQRFERRGVDANRVRVIDPLGSERTYTLQTVAGVRRIVQQSQPAGAGCLASTRSQTFDVRGNVASRDDFKGQRTCHAHDQTRNLEIARVEGLGTAANCSALTVPGAALPGSSRKTSTQWHPDWRLQTKVAQPLRLTRYIYNGQPDPTDGGALASCAPPAATLPDGQPIAVLCKRVERSTTDSNGAQGFGATVQAGVPARVWRYTYDEHGQVLTETDPLMRVTRYAYYSDTAADHTMGDLQSVTNALNQVTTFTRYDRRGQVLQRVDANGDVTEYAYDPRHRLVGLTVAGQTTTYDYGPTGLLVKVTAPDGRAVDYGYDAAQRLTSIADDQGNRIDYTLDAAGHRTGETVKDVNGELRRELTRLTDALGRIQQATGRE